MGDSSDNDEAVRAIQWIKEFCEAHHAGEPAGVHLHRLLVDVPHYLDYVLAVLAPEREECPNGTIRAQADAASKPR